MLIASTRNLERPNVRVRTLNRKSKKNEKNTHERKKGRRRKKR
jgi:hypothetical protein